jgi:bacteriorhodopsin
VSSPTPPENRVPRSTHVLMVAIMLFFFLTATLISLSATWYWYAFPLVPAVVMIVMLAQRYSAMKARRAPAATARGVRR